MTLEHLILRQKQLRNIHITIYNRICIIVCINGSSTEKHLFIHYQVQRQTENYITTGREYGKTKLIKNQNKNPQKPPKQ